MLGVRFSFLYFSRIGRTQSSNVVYLLFGTIMFPVRLIPLSLRVEPSRLKLPILKSLKHLMKSSSIPPAVVTMTSTILCWTRYLKMSRSPDVTMFDV